MTATQSTEQTLADLVTENPARALLLERLGLDFCCHGERSLTDACTSAGLDPEEVAIALGSVAQAGSSTWTGGRLGELVAHLESTHHSYLHAELGSLESLSQKVASVHGMRHPELGEVASTVGEIAADLRPHLAAEEQEVFPAIASLAPGASAHDQLTARIDELVAEHAALGVKLGRLRELTAGYTVPEDGCASYRSLYERLAHLESDTHIHIHLENNVLFPAAAGARRV